MSKEEILKIQKCVLKVNIHCDGCKQKVKKILQKIDGVFTTDIDADQGKVTVTGNVDSALLIKKLAKSGKHAEVWGAPKPNSNQNQNHMASQFKNMKNDPGKGGGNGNNSKGQKGGNNQPKGGQQGQHQQQQQLLQHQQRQQQFQQQLQQLEQLQQIKGLQDLKLPQFKDLKMSGQNPNQKAVKFDLPEDDDLTDDEYDEFDDEDYDDDEFDDEFDDPEVPLYKMKPAMPNNSPRPNLLMNGHYPQLMATAQKGGNATGNGQKGGGGPVAVPVQVNSICGPKNGGKQGGGGGGSGNNQKQGGGKQNGGKNGGGFPQQPKNGNDGGGANNKNNNNGNGGGNGGKKHNGMSEGPHSMSNVFQTMNGHPGMAAAEKMGGMGTMNSMPMAQMNNMSMGQMSSIPAVQGLPAGSGDGYYKGGAGLDVIAGNPYHQQQQQQRAMGNDRFQPMMYARPPPAVNYTPPFPYAPHPSSTDPYTHYFSDENTSSSCSIT